MTHISRAATLIAIAAALAGGGAWWWKSHQGAAAAGAKAGAAGAAGAGAARGGGPAVLVTAFTARRQDVPVTIEVNGSVVSLNSVDVRPQVSNMVQKVHVKEGQFVRAGELLFTLDDRVDKANLDKAQAQQLRDQATLGDLERQYKRNQDLVAQKFIAQSAADNSLSQVQAQRALVASDAAAVASAKVALGFDVLRSPTAGRIGGISFFPGSLAQPTAVLVTVTQLDPIGVSFPVPEGSLQDLLAAAKRHASVTASVPGTASATTGTLSFVDNTVDPAIGTVRAKAVFANGAQRLWPGQYVTVRATTRMLKDATVLPSAAIITNTNGKLVYVVGADMTAQPRKVQVDYSFGQLAVVQGVMPGDRIVIDGKQNLRPGSRVRVEAPAASAAAPQRAAQP